MQAAGGLLTLYTRTRDGAGEPAYPSRSAQVPMLKINLLFGAVPFGARLPGSQASECEHFTLGQLGRVLL
jgi:hypothetical protein